MSLLDINLVHVDPSTFTKKRKRTATACQVRWQYVLGSPNQSSGHAFSDTELFPDDSPSRGPCKTLSELPCCGVDMQVAGLEGSELPLSASAVGYPSSSTSLAESPGTHMGNSHDGNNSEPSSSGLSQTIMPLTIQSPVPRTQAPLDRFEAYIEDTLGLYAPSFRHHTAKTVSNNRNAHSGLDLEGLNCERRLEVEMATRPTVELEKHMASLDAADMELLKAKGAFDLPPRDLQEELINAFFSEVHPTTPVINKTQFLSDFHSNRMSSRLLLFAVLASGSRACRNPALLDDKGTVHSSALRFYKATKALLDTGYEISKLKRIQALMLITWWWDKKDDGGRNMRSCVVDALNTAQSIGMHRWDHYPQNDPATVGVWKRTWWSCFNRDVFVGVAHGLPSTLSFSEFDVPPLSPEDFDEEPGVQEGLRRYPHSNMEIRFFIEQTRVMEALHHIHRGFFVRQRLHDHMTGSIAQREASCKRKAVAPGAKADQEWYPDSYQDEGLLLCRDWLEQLPDILQYDVDDVRGHKFWPAFLHILYYTNIMLRFREKSVSRPRTARVAAEREYSQARGIDAATMISKIIRNVRAHGQVLRCTGQLTTSIFNCLIFFLVEGQSLNADVRRDAQRKYSMCLNVLYDFSQIWVSASLIHRLFNKRSASLLAGQLHSPLPGQTTSSAITNSYMKQ
ncbi:hypothetical protein CONLIGDRAFT_697198 [Coniochaeta ligniaria NRRL 30616]|uniref:Xylanolytic transcriptional activator regulatory domain-containing protein n=1 Tax=Coniochaeta ligniaria NRRL 30616 TaxID=1408157 RepID=A0A1J7I5B8_9PEZI|nr:hypothetical protein CONLIGDRAFT_697198 [Coniochaeta ligniaria NRRL 30616]